MSEPKSPATFEERAEARRRSWPLRRTTLGGEAGAEAEEGTTASPTEALDATAAWRAVIELTAESYSLAGYDRAAVALPRAQWPSRLFQPGEPRPDTHGLL
jgi:hypothetical protein